MPPSLRGMMIDESAGVHLIDGGCEGPCEHASRFGSTTTTWPRPLRRGEKAALEPPFLGLPMLVLDILGPLDEEASRFLHAVSFAAQCLV